MNVSDDKSKEKKSLREFGLTVGIAFGVLAALLYWRHKPHYIYFVPISGALVLLGLLAPVVLKPVRKGWMAMAAALGFVMARVILTVLFFAVFTPLGVIARAAGKRFLEVGIDKSKQSYWVRKKTARAETDRFEKQF
jgi:Na+/H+-translocating membrane pyrophosphatase